MNINLQLIKDKFCICKLDNLTDINLQSEFFFLAKTDSEISLVCREEDVPPNCKAIDMGWRGIRVIGPLDFSLVGILSKISDTLAEAKVPIFAVSTYDTDYILIKQNHIVTALRALSKNGYSII